MDLSPFATKLPRPFFASTKQLDRRWKEQAARFTDLKQLSTIAKEEQIEWLNDLLNCPSDDLRGCCFPKKCFLPGSMPFTMQYHTLACTAEMLQENGLVPHASASEQHYLHCIHLSLPRYVLDQMGKRFSLQQVWKERLLRMAAAFETGVGLMKMDCYSAGRCHPLLSGCGNFKLGFATRVHDTGWGLCLNRDQIALLGGVDALRHSDVFYSITELENGSAVLQLTPDVSVVPLSKAKALWRLLSPYIDLVEYQMNHLGDVPPSMRFGIPVESLRVNGARQYRLIKPEPATAGSYQEAHVREPLR